MKLFVRRQASDDRQLKLIARADQRKADRQRETRTNSSESPQLHARVMSEEERTRSLRLSADRQWTPS